MNNKTSGGVLSIFGRFNEWGGVLSIFGRFNEGGGGGGRGGCPFSASSTSGGEGGVLSTYNCVRKMDKRGGCNLQNP